MWIVSNYKDGALICLRLFFFHDCCWGFCSGAGEAASHQVITPMELVASSSVSPSLIKSYKSVNQLSEVHLRNEPSQVQLFSEDRANSLSLISPQPSLFSLLVCSVWKCIFALHVEIDPWVKAWADQVNAEHVCSGTNLTSTPKISRPHRKTWSQTSSFKWEWIC